jgi:hypothetical protein
MRFPMPKRTGEAVRGDFRGYQDKAQVEKVPQN